MIASRTRAAYRLRRTRLILSTVFTSVTALCLGLLIALALQIDGSSKEQQVTSDVSDRANGLARAVYFDGMVLHLEPLAEDELAVGASFVGVYELGPGGMVARTVFTSPATTDLLPAEERTELIGAVLDAQGATHDLSSTTSGVRVVWGAAPVWNGDSIGAVVIVGQDPAPLTAAFDRLATGLILAGAGLLVAAAAAGYVVSGRAIRPAVQALARQEQFLTEAAHELRTPLTTLRLTLEAASDSEQERPLEMIDRIDHLLTALLLRARISAGTFEPEQILFRLDQVVEQVANEVFDNNTITFDLEPVIIRGDPTLLSQAVRNLIDNAHRHAPGPTQVTVRAHRVIVTDHGTGILTEQRNSMLQPGAHSSSGAGTGTGLAIVDWVTNLHRGTMHLTDVPGGGLEVELVFPAPS